MFSGFTLIYGPPGSGKTSLALHIARKLGDNIMYIGMYENREKILSKLSYLGLDPSVYKIYDFINVKDRTAVIKLIGEEFVQEAPSVVVIDGINYFPQDRETLSAIYRTFDVPVIAVGEEDTRRSPLAYIVDVLLEVRQIISRGSRYRVARFLKSRTGQPPAAEFRFVVTSGGIVFVEPWSSLKLGDPLGKLPMRRVQLEAPELAELRAGSRTAYFVDEDPESCRIMASLLCDYADAVKAALIEFRRGLEMPEGCRADGAVIPPKDLGDERGLDELKDSIGDAGAALLYGLDEALGGLGRRRVQYVLDFLSSWRRELMTVAAFVGVSPSPELMGMFNAVWHIGGGRAELLKSRLFPAHRSFCVEKRGDVYRLAVCP